MPPTPGDTRKHSSARRSTPNTRSSPKDVATTTPNLFETPSIQDRIRNWQEQGAAIASAPDTLSVRSPPRSDSCISPPLLSTHDLHVDGEDRPSSSPNVGRGRTTDQGSRPWVKQHRSTTPKKRIVSDEHWRAKRSTERTRTTTAKERKPLEKALLDTVLPNHNVDRTIEMARAEREERRNRRKDARDKRLDARKRGDRENVHQIPVATEPHVSPAIEDETLLHGFNRDATNQSPNHSSTSPAQYRSPSNDGSQVWSDRGDEEDVHDRSRVGEGSRYAETLGNPTIYADGKPMKSRKGSIFDKTKNILGMSDQPPIIPNRLPSIEAWLFDQPDLVLEEEFRNSRDMPEVTQIPEPIHTPRPLKRSSKKKKTSNVNLSPQDPNKIWDLLNTSTNDEQTETHIPHAGPSGNKGEKADASPTSLHRRTARSSRPKRRTLSQPAQPLRENQEQNISGRNEASIPSIEQHTDSIHAPTRPTKSYTVASVEKFQEEQVTYEQQQQFEQCNLKRKLTTHEDLMSVLSLPQSTRGLRKTRSVNISEPRVKEAIVPKLLDQMRDDETKYNRELRTLIDGVIPVLLQCALSKNDSAAMGGLFASSKKDSLSMTRPVIDMGIALERMKSLHNRIPLHNVDSLLSWCQTAHKAYSDYLKAWRLGFQDVIVNLAPLNDTGTDNSDDIMARDVNGDVVNADGEKVDVAYLMKRPLVRIRKLGKDLSILKENLPDNPIISKLADDFTELALEAKRKHQAERGRLEDEAAARTDVTKVRDIRTMAPTTSVTVNKTRKVRARDCFDMTLYHSTGQRMDCRIEVILRDNQPGDPAGGDLLICEMEEDCKWLLFAPVELSLISCRRDESSRDLVVMIRGRAGMGTEWHELLALKADDQEAAAEWMNMLGSKPLPPKLSRVPTFVDQQAFKVKDVPTETTGLTASTLREILSDEVIDVPIGEPSIIGVVEPRRVEKSSPAAVVIQQPATKLNMGGGLQQKRIPDHWQAHAPSIQRKSVPASTHSSDRSVFSDRSANSSQGFKPVATMREEELSRHSRGQSVDSIHPKDTKTPLVSSRNLGSTQRLSMPSKLTTADIPKLDDTQRRSTQPAQPQQSSLLPQQVQHSSHQNQPLVPEVRVSPKLEDDHSNTITSSAPAQELPHVAKLRPASTISSSSSIPLTDNIRDKWAAISGYGQKTVVQPATPNVEKTLPSQTIFTEDVPSPKQIVRTSLPAVEKREQPPAPPKHKEIPPLRSRSQNVPSLPPSTTLKNNQFSRLSSSPLRHEYEPSTESESGQESDSDYTEDSSSETSEDEGSELNDQFTPLVSIAKGAKRLSRSGPQPQVPPTESAPTTGARTLAPSDSASQGPYRQAPSSSAYPAEKKKRTIAMVCSWSDRGMWEPIREDECSIVVSPGLIEAFSMSSAHSQPLPGADVDGTLRSSSDKPLVAFELTPIVPLRKGTALDITIRSPSTSNSQVRTTNNIMFRSRSVMECEALYHMINWARCNNPTYIQLERSRPRVQPTVTFSTEQAPRPRSWFSFGSGPKRQNSYRAGSMPPPSISESTGSAGTVSSAFSVLKRLSQGSAFNINRSSVIRRPGHGTSQSLYSSSSGTNITGSGSGSSTPAPSQYGHIPGKEGPNVPATSAAAVNGGGMVNNMKVKFFVRTGQNWQTLGTSRLSVLPAPVATPSASRPASSSGSPTEALQPTSRRTSTVGFNGPPGPHARQFRLPSSSHTPHRVHGNGREKRIMVTKNKKADQVLLDEVLGESCFEKVMQTGIAISVWRETEAVGDQGGVLTGRNVTYMIQFFSSSEASWVFGLCGTYRYGMGGATD